MWTWTWTRTWILWGQKDEKTKNKRTTSGIPTCNPGFATKVDHWGTVRAFSLAFPEIQGNPDPQNTEPHVFFSTQL